ncbi:erythromycin biosynthesis sensory transduction protein eryC1 [Pseudomonas sp. RU47]|uniref:DegT/DnrJ/EryC1/StrS family aminotransferase n=1 Tax=Pseudomonas sp. RU47 TaxID=2005388 RepID=UPI000FDED06F|nr:DegT/DnrJ/EryC1/StrS family aminotransferase [Pseudomonas sp. RU47]AZZ77557.1 erythromycin biosynthesis sensory transduction protein eryC1 [Pseudomonas sp. RU47]
MPSVNIPLFSAHKANDSLDFVTPIKKVLESHWYILGAEVKAFEAEFAEYTGVKHCISVANGSEALELALLGLGVKQNDYVVAVANAGFYGSTAIHAVGAKPLYVDIANDTLTMCPVALKASLDLKPSAIIVTHLYGQLANIEEIVSIASAAGIPVLEDCAQSHGASRNGKLAGSFGTIACFSFYPTKNLGALGDGGAIVTNHVEVAEKVLQLRQYGWSKKYHVEVPNGRNSRLDEMQAAILRVKLPHLDTWNAQRRSIAQRYNNAFAHLDMQLPHSINEDFVAHLYVVRVKNRDDFAQYMSSHQISTDIHYPVADHMQPAYNSSKSKSMSLSQTEEACQSVISLPCFPGLPDEDVQRVIDAVVKYFSEGK